MHIYKSSRSFLTTRLLALVYVLLMMGCSANADSFEEGKHYTIIKDAKPSASENVKVVEFFNYACPHCFHVEPVIDTWKKAKADYIEFERVPAFWNPLFQHMAQAYYTADLLGKIDVLHGPIFQAIHVTKRNIKDPASLGDLFSEHGVEVEQFNKTYSSFAVQQKLSLANAQFKEYGLRAVPSFVIDGVYVTTMRDAGDSQTLIKVIDYLAKKAKLAKAK